MVLCNSSDKGLLSVVWPDELLVMVHMAASRFPCVPRVCTVHGATVVMQWYWCYSESCEAWLSQYMHTVHTNRQLNWMTEGMRKTKREADRKTVTDIWRGIHTTSQLFDDDFCHNFSHMVCLISLISTLGQLYGSWGYITIRLYIWELSFLDTPWHIKATESTESSFHCWRGREKG